MPKITFNNPLDGFKKIGNDINKAVDKASAHLQTEIFNGPLGKAVSEPPKTGWVAKGISRLGLTAFTPAPPPPVLKRPVVMITGLTMQAASYDPMAKHLASNSANGKVAVYVVADGKFHDGSVAGKVLTDAEAAKTKMFQIQYTDVKGAPSDKEPQLEKAFRAIKRATNAPALDVVAHSAGCTDFRLYLEKRPAADKAIGINEAVFIGPASHGTAMGNVGDAVGRPLGVEKAGTELEIGSPLVKQLNDDWAAQRNQVKGNVTIVGISGAPTPGQGGLSNGDGFMPVNQLNMANANTVVLKGSDPTPIAHLMEVGTPASLPKCRSGSRSNAYSDFSNATIRLANPRGSSRNGLCPQLAGRSITACFGRWSVKNFRWLGGRIRSAAPHNSSTGIFSDFSCFAVNSCESAIPSSTASVCGSLK